MILGLLIFAAPYLSSSLSGRCCLCEDWAAQLLTQLSNLIKCSAFYLDFFFNLTFPSTGKSHRDTESRFSEMPDLNKDRSDGKFSSSQRGGSGVSYFLPNFAKSYVLYVNKLFLYSVFL